MSLDTFDPYGFWHVTSEGDCEGRTVRELGTHLGNLDEIAFYLAPKAYYGLHFERVTNPQPEKYTPNDCTVQVSIADGPNRSSSFTSQDRVHFVRRSLRANDSDTLVSPSQYYGCVTLELPKSKAAMAKLNRLIDSAVQKLSDEELKALATKFKENS